MDEPTLEGVSEALARLGEAGFGSFRLERLRLGVYKATGTNRVVKLNFEYGYGETTVSGTYLHRKRRFVSKIVPLYEAITPRLELQILPPRASWLVWPEVLRRYSAAIVEDAIDVLMGTGERIRALQLRFYHNLAIAEKSSGASRIFLHPRLLLLLGIPLTGNLRNWEPPPIKDIVIR